MNVIKKHFLVLILSIISICLVIIVFRNNHNEKNVLNELGNHIDYYSSNAAWAFDVQVEPLKRKSEKLCWYPVISDTLVLVVNKERYTESIDTFDEMVDENVEMLLRDKYPDHIFLMLSIAYAKNYSFNSNIAFNFMKEITDLKIKNTMLCNYTCLHEHLKNENSAYLCFNHEALKMIEKFSDLEIIKINENLPSFSYGVLSTDKIPSLENNIKTISGFTGDIDEFNKAARVLIPFSNKTEYGTETSLFSRKIYLYLITMLLTICWLTMNIKFIQNKNIRNALAFQLIFIFSWLFLKILNTMIHDNDISRFCWYFYFVAISYVPMFSLYVTYTCDKKENYQMNKLMYTWLLLTFTAIFIIFTNDYHNLFIVFTNRRYLQYEYGIIFYIYVINAIAQLIVSIFLMIYKSFNSPRKKRVIAPIIVCIFFVMYVFVFSNEYSAIFEPDLSIAWIVFSVALIQSEIYTGIIQTNNKYMDMFNYSTLDMSIYDDEERLIYNSAGNSDYSLVRKMHINSGYITWMENNKALEMKNEQLKKAIEQLNYEYYMLKQSKEIESRKLTLMTRKKIYAKVEEVVLSKIIKITALLASLDKHKREDELIEMKETENILAVVGMILCYIKKKSHLLIHEQQYRLIESCDLNIALSEILEYANKTGSDIGFIYNIKNSMPVVIAIYIYDFVESIIENMIVLNKADFLIRVYQIKNQYMITVIADSVIDYLPLKNSMIRNYDNIIIDFSEYDDDRFVLNIVMEETDE